ncbi:MAG TPA: methionine--tRNA ligase subunit beta [Candidatus Atribacteria bacterium]|nr:methionine--tRNA ligase subunit beta [Candidatus Atribacteria bacterium]
MNNLALNTALESIWQFIRRTNKYIDQTEPWILGRDNSGKERLSTILYNLAESIRLFTILIYPFMPVKAREIWKQLGLKDDLAALKLDKEAHWGNLQAGILVKPGKIIFPRIEINKKVTKKIEEKEVEIISYEEFKKIDLRVGKIIDAEPASGTDKLLKLKVNLGKEIRTIVAGVREHYSAENILGKKIIIVYNLKPRKIRGIESQGMLLAAVDNHNVVLLTVDRDITEGSKVQ